MMKNKNIKIMCMQEVKFQADFNANSLGLSGYQLEIEKNAKCCVFPPANKCSARRLLIEINCFYILTSFFCIFWSQTFFPRSRPAFGCQPMFKSNTYMLVDPPFFIFLFYFGAFLFLVSDRKIQKNLF